MLLKFFIIDLELLNRFLTSEEFFIQFSQFVLKLLTAITKHCLIVECLMI